MTAPYIFISHRWEYSSYYDNLTARLKGYGFGYSDYSVPHYNPLDANRKNEIKKALKEQIRQCNYFLIFGHMALATSEWCQYEVEVAREYGKPILSVRPHGYIGNIPVFIQQADTEGGSIGFNTPSIIRKICARLNHPLPVGV